MCHHKAKEYYMRARLLQDGRFVSIPLDRLEQALDVRGMLVRTNSEKEVNVVPYLFTDEQDE